MRKILLVLIWLLTDLCVANAQEQDTAKMKVYCDVMCVQYNVFKGDVNAMVDFGIADKAKNAEGWIYNPETNKKMSFASPMNVFAYMARRGWEYKDAIIIHDPNRAEGQQNVWHFILSKEVPVDCTSEDIIGNIDYRNK